VNKRVSVGEVIPLRPGHGPAGGILDTVPVRAEPPQVANDTGADLANVVPFMRPREGRTAPSVALPTDGVRLPPANLARQRARLAAFFIASVALHAGLFMALWREPPPLASIGLEVMSVEIVLGATAPAGAAAAEGEQQTNSAAAPQTEVVEAEKAEAKATAQEQTVEVARQETAPEQPQTEVAKSETPPEPKTDEAKPEAPNSEIAATPEKPTEQTPAVTIVEAPTPDSATATPQGTPPAATEISSTDLGRVTLLPPPEEKAIERKSEPKPMRTAPPKPVKDTRPAKEQRRIAAPTRENASREAKASTPSTAANNIGVGRSDRDTNYPGLVAAHLRRYQQYPSDARGRGDQGTATVSFSLDGNGRVTSTRLAGGSGIASIDQEVQAMVRRASPFPAPPSGHAQSFTVPVRFRLN